MPGPTRSSVGAIGVVFFVNGASFANWLPRIDEVRDSIGVSNNGLGMALLGGGLGGILGSLVAARVLRPGAILGILGRSAAALALAFPLIAVVPNALTLLVLLTFLGFSDVLCDTAMNAEAAAIQAGHDGSIIHRIHGMWSFGFVSGTIVGWGASALDVPLVVHLTAVSALLLVTSLRSVAALSAAHVPPPESPDPVATPPSAGRSRLHLAIVPFALAAATFEVVPNDWSATALRDWLDAGRLKGAGPVVFAGAMLIGRFRGDRILDRIGASRMLATALATVAAGVGVILVAPHAIVALIGFALWGLGVSVMFPQVYLMAANADPDHPGAGLAAMTLAQRGGFMAATASMGLVSASAGYGVAFAVVAGVAAALWVVGLAWSRAGSSGRDRIVAT